MLNSTELISKSWVRSYKKQVPRDLKHPRNYISGKELRKKLEKNRLLIEIFNRQIREIPDYYRINNLIIMLTDSEGMLLDYSCSDDKMVKKCRIKEGVYFTERSCGTNAISLAMNSNRKIKIPGDIHYCFFLQDWECVAAAIRINDSKIGYLNISAIENNFKKDILYVFDYLFNKISLQYIDATIFSNGRKELLENDEVEVLRCVALGYSIEIADNFIIMQ